MRLLIPILAILMLASCRTTKNVQTTRVVTDSTVERGLEEHVRMLERELQERSRDSSVTTVTEVVFEQCDSIATPATVVFNDNGKLASVSGQLKSVKQQLSEEVAERYTLTATIDSLAERLEYERSVKKIEYREREKVVERRYIPWWVWLIVTACIAVAVRGEFKKRKIFTMHIYPLLLLGTWPVGLLLLAGAVIFFYFAYRAHNSGWKQQDPRTGKTYYGDEKLPYTKIGQFWFGVACMAALVAYLLIQLSER